MDRRSIVILFVCIGLFIWGSFWQWNRESRSLLEFLKPMGPSAPKRTNGIPSKSLVIVMGSLRGGELAWETLHSHVLKPNGADLALAIPENSPSKTSLHTRARFVWEFREYEDWADAIDETFGENAGNWRKHLLEDNPNVCRRGLLGAAGECPGSGVIIYMYRYYIIQKIKELGLLEKYERFVLTRSDHYYKCEHSFRDLDSSKVWVPKGEDYGNGITDRHVIAGKDMILKVLNIMEPFIRNAENYRDITDNPEQFILRRWREEGVTDKLDRFDRMMFTCHIEGDVTRWREGFMGPLKEEGVRLKYAHEYFASRCYCSGGAFKYQDDVHGNCTCPAGTTNEKDSTCVSPTELSAE